MATLVLQNVGALIGTALGGPFGGMLGRAAGALAGSAIDQKLFGKDRIVEGPRLEQMRLLASSEGADMPRVYGRARIGGQIVWATRFEEVINEEEQGGGKGGGNTTTIREFSYYANFAVGICEGPVNFIGRIWADGVELDRTEHEIRTYLGGDDQQADPLIEAKQGAENVPAFRGTAYVVFEHFALENFGNRIPQISFEIIRSVSKLDRSLRAVCVIPGATEFGYLPTPVTANGADGLVRTPNRNCLTHESDWQASMDELQALCPNLETVALVVAWFGDDLRAGHCSIKPGVEYNDAGVSGWLVNGVTRTQAREVTRIEGSPAYGGTPSDSAVVAAIADLRARGLKVVLYPFVMMDVAPGNGLPDPHGGTEQAAYPWRGRISCFPGPAAVGSADTTAAARVQVNAFAGTASISNFPVNGTAVGWSGGADFGYRRMVLHYAHLAAAAGGVDGFLIGSEMRGLTTLRDQANAFPFVEALVDLAADVRSILGTQASLTYGADWSEYFGYASPEGDRFFHLDPLWAHPAIDAVGIDNYMPLTDWRGDTDPADSNIHSNADPDYLAANIEGGEGFDWYYASPADRDSGLRSLITDGSGEPWIWRFKDLRAWWEKPHHERVNGVRSPTPTAWVAASKPFWFTEFGCPAIHNGANQPNVFSDPKSAESATPYFSNGARDDLAQYRFLQAHLSHWGEGGGASNPVSPVYGGTMVDPAGMFAWAWDARPFPQFPSNTETWADGINWHTGHWLNGRLGGCPVDELCAALAGDFGVTFDKDRGDVFIDGYVVPGPSSARAALEPLAAIAGLHYSECGAQRHLLADAFAVHATIPVSDLARVDDAALMARDRDQDNELPARIELAHAELFSGFDGVLSRSRQLEFGSRREQTMQAPAVLPQSTARGLVDKRLRGRWTARERLSIALPPRHRAVSAGDILSFDAAPGQDQIEGLWKVVSIEDGEARRLALRSITHSGDIGGSASVPRPVDPPKHAQAPAFIAMNLPLLPELSRPHVHVVLSASPWERRYGLWSSPSLNGFVQRGSVTRPAILGKLLTPLGPGPSGRWDRAGVADVLLGGGALSSRDELAVFDGANAAAIRCANGEWEILQFGSAQLIAAGQWRISGLLRGQLGTEPAMAAGAAIGADLVVINRAMTAVELTSGEIGQTRNWRAGGDGKPVASDAFTAITHTHDPIARRPLSPVHLRAQHHADASITFSWIRRTRIDGDSWETAEAPLGETSERYRLEILSAAGSILRSVESTSPAWTYGPAEQAQDFGASPVEATVRIRQIGDGEFAGSPATLSLSL